MVPIIGRSPSQAVVPITSRSPSQAGTHHRQVSITGRSPSQAGLHHRQVSITGRSPSQAGPHHCLCQLQDGGHLDFAAGGFWKYVQPLNWQSQLSPCHHSSSRGLKATCKLPLLGDFLHTADPTFHWRLMKVGHRSIQMHCCYASYHMGAIFLLPPGLSFPFTKDMRHDHSWSTPVCTGRVEMVAPSCCMS